MNQRIDRTGIRYGRLTAVAYGGNKKWLCRCDCGNTTHVRSEDLSTGHIKSCGCLRKELNAGRVRTHGKSGSPEHNVWAHMRRRCNDPKSDQYKWYGGRGITICSQWDDFATFLADMGERPDGMTLDRIDPNGNYEPSNCRWATRLTQVRNTVKSVTFEGKHIKVWAEELGVKYHTLYARLKKKGSIWPL